LQFSSCDPWRVFGHSNSPPHRSLGWYRHTSSSRQICNIFGWLKPLNYCPDCRNGNFLCFSSFFTATFYFVKLNNIVLHIRTIFLGFTPCDGLLREFIKNWNRNILQRYFTQSFLGVAIMAANMRRRKKTYFIMWVSPHFQMFYLNESFFVNSLNERSKR